MKQLFMTLCMATLCTMTGMSQLRAADEGVMIQEVDVQYGQTRPFNWYYHESFEYYYPRHRFHGSCQWYYSDGSYRYYCY